MAIIAKNICVAEFSLKEISLQFYNSQKQNGVRDNILKEFDTLLKNT